MSSDQIVRYLLYIYKAFLYENHPMNQIQQFAWGNDYLRYMHIVGSKRKYVLKIYMQ